jgi:hypothetical protein
MRLILNAIDSAQSARVSELIRKTGNPVQPHRRLIAAFVSHRDFNAIRITRKRHVQVRMLPNEMCKRFLAGSDDGRLQFDHRVARQTSRLREVARYTPCRSREPRIGVNLQLNASGFSGHCGCSREPRRKLHGSPGNNTSRPRTASR